MMLPRDRRLPFFADQIRQFKGIIPLSLSLFLSEFSREEEGRGSWIFERSVLFFIGQSIVEKFSVSGF